MDGLVLGMAMLLASTGAVPAPDSARTTLVPAAMTFDLPDDRSASAHSGRSFLGNRLRTAKPRMSFPPAQATSTKRFSKTDRIIAIAAGVSIGWIAGGAIGAYSTADWDRDDDGTSGLKGFVIGAPIGAVAGAVIGYRLTR